MAAAQRHFRPRLLLKKRRILSQAPFDARRLFNATAGFGRRVRRIGLEHFFQRRLMSGQWTRRTLPFELLEPLDSPFTIEGHVPIDGRV